MNCLRSQWYAQMKRALDLSGKSPATQESYLRSVRQLADYLQKEVASSTELKNRAFVEWWMAHYKTPDRAIAKLRSMSCYTRGLEDLIRKSGSRGQLDCRLRRA